MFRGLGRGQYETRRAGRDVDLKLPAGQLVASLLGILATDVLVTAAVLVIGPSAMHALVQAALIVIAVAFFIVAFIATRRWARFAALVVAVIASFVAVWWRAATVVVTLRQFLKAVVVGNVPLVLISCGVFVASMWREMVNPNMPAPRQAVSEYQPPLPFLGWLFSPRFREAMYHGLFGGKEPDRTEKHVVVAHRVRHAHAQSDVVADMPLPTASYRVTGDSETITTFDPEETGLPQGDMGVFIRGVLGGAPFSRNHWEGQGMSQTSLRSFFSWMADRGIARKQGNAYELTEEGREAFECYSEGD